MIIEDNVDDNMRKKDNTRKKFFFDDIEDIEDFDFDYKEKNLTNMV